MNLDESKNYVLGLGTLALINAGLAQSKGRRVLNWFFLTLFLGPFATFLIVYMSPLNPN
ncbi:MAG TPA: hypothetical protein VI911_09555 [Patescibacteria group bacterium]|nr:hypothetical protein [Patescibacteria group bacterium]